MEIYIVIATIVIAYLIYSKISAPKITWISRTALDAMLQEKNVKRNYVDVRTLDEFKTRKIKGFQNIPLQSLQKRKNEIDQSLPVILICASGSRATVAAKHLHKSGYTQLYNVKGGIGH